MSKELVGVDLSPKMIEQARRHQLYDDLQAVELVEYMRRVHSRFDLIVSADTLVYFGDLSEVLDAAAAALRSHGIFAFSLEDLESDAERGYQLNGSGRYSHRRDYVTETAKKAGLVVVAIQPAVLRFELQRPVHGLVAVCRLAAI